MRPRLSRAIVVGASSRIGEAIARRLVQDDGAEVALVTRRAPELARGASVDPLLSISGRVLPKLFEPPDWTAGSERVADVAKARRLLGWTATTPIESGLARTFRWLAAVGDQRTKSK